jgi:hypothetical protein
LKFINQNYNIRRPSAPKTIIWIIALIAGILGIIGHFVFIGYVTDYNYWLLLCGFVLLAFGTTFKSF